MKYLLIVASLFISTAASAATECTTRKSGSVSIETCTDTKRKVFTQCRSYMSGSVRKTSCRS